MLKNAYLLAPNAGGFFTIASTGNSGNGTNSNTFTYVDEKGNTYNRQVSAVDNVITSDHQSGSLAPAPVPATDSGTQAPFTVAKFRLPGGRKVGN